MSARSSAPDRRRWLVAGGAAVAALATACSSGPRKPEADPERVRTLFATIDKNSPVPGGAPFCRPDQMIGGATMTQMTLLKIANVPMNAGPEREDWTNPAQLDVPAARELLDPNVDDLIKRQAAYELLSAPFYLIYRADHVDAPMALKIKELKRGSISLRALRYNKQGAIVCLKPIIVQNTLEVSDDAILKSNLIVMDPKVAEELRIDLSKNILTRVAALGRPDDNPDY